MEIKQVPLSLTIIFSLTLDWTGFYMITTSAMKELRCGKLNLVCFDELKLLIW